MLSHHRYIDISPSTPCARCRRLDSKIRAVILSVVRFPTFEPISWILWDLIIRASLALVPSERAFLMCAHSLCRRSSRSPRSGSSTVRLGSTTRPCSSLYAIPCLMLSMLTNWSRCFHTPELNDSPRSYGYQTQNCSSKRICPMTTLCSSGQGTTSDLSFYLKCCVGDAVLLLRWCIIFAFQCGQVRPL